MSSLSIQNPAPVTSIAATPAVAPEPGAAVPSPGSMMPADALQLSPQARQASANPAPTDPLDPAHIAQAQSDLAMLVEVNSAYEQASSPPPASAPSAGGQPASYSPYQTGTYYPQPSYPSYSGLPTYVPPPANPTSAAPQNGQADATYQVQQAGTVTYDVPLASDPAAQMQEYLSQAQQLLAYPDPRWPMFSQTQATDLYTRAAAAFDQLPDSPQKQQLGQQLSALAAQLGQAGAINPNAIPANAPDVSFSSPPDQKARSALAMASQALAQGDATSALMDFNNATTYVDQVTDPTTAQQLNQQLLALQTQLTQKGILQAPTPSTAGNASSTSNAATPGSATGTASAGTTGGTSTGSASTSTASTGGSATGNATSGQQANAGAASDTLPNGETPQQMISNAVMGSMSGSDTGY